MKKGKFVENSLNTLGVQFTGLVISFVISIITARVLGPDGRGQLALLLLIPVFSITLGRIGLGHAVNYYFSKTSPTKLILSSSFLALILSISLTALSIIFVSICRNVFFRSINHALLIFVSFSVPVYFFNSHFISLLQAFYKIKAWNILFLTQSVLYLFLLILLVLILKLGLLGVLISSSSALLITAVLACANIAKHIKIQEIALDFTLIGNLLRFGFKSHVGNVLKDLNYRGDLFIISYFLSPSMVGFYVVATNVAEIIWKIPDAVGAVLLPKVAQLSKEEARNFTPKVCRVVLMPVFMIGVFIVIFSNLLVTSIFGISYKPAVSALILLVPGILALTLWKILASTIIALGYPLQYSLTTAIALLIMILFDLIFVPFFGINGAALASTFAYITATVYIVVIYRRITRNSVRSLLIPQKADFDFYKVIFFSQS